MYLRRVSISSQYLEYLAFLRATFRGIDSERRDFYIYRIIKEYDVIEVSTIEVYSDMYQSGEGYIQKERRKRGVSGKSYPMLYK